MTIRPPTDRMIDCAKRNAKALGIELPQKAIEEYIFCKWFNLRCWALLPPLYRYVCDEVELCEHLGITVNLSEFKSRLEFEIWFAPIRARYEATVLKIDELLQSRDGVSEAPKKSKPRHRSVSYIDSSLNRIRNRFKH
ncbi:hypothetical protein [Marinobacter salsuginis]|uniref:Uncharacterized protein n=1 Tax=Marinobacter salsuginis TaxID=418719 RepID=A0A5M3PWW2_9GAMM|nr:hypothetical protein [Marinobacter salsuginis]GBO87321.1 hypothetical protein MSSD14B_09890 [Marinobacter salsuginis]